MPLNVMILEAGESLWGPNFIMMLKTEIGWRKLGWRRGIYLTFKLD